MNLEEKLCLNKKNGWLLKPELRDTVFDFCEGYKDFLNKSRTEREFAINTVIEAEKQGFRPLSSFDSLKPGDKVYRVNRGKAVLLAVIGTENIEEGINIIGAHIDSPRLDLKQVPFLEDTDIAFLKTHYYGGIKKYQWTTIPLALHGKVCLANGDEVDLAIGDEGDDVTFTISDLLPHLAQEQAKKTMGQIIDAENLNIIIGSIPLDDKDAKNPVKLAILDYLNKTYGIVEADFLSAEIEAVPAFNLKDIGFDRSMIGGPGQDDRICAYPELMALFDIDTPKKTAVCLLVDKEEIGSMGNTGMKSRFFENTLAEMINLMGQGELSLRRCLSASKCISADVNAAFDPAYASVMDKQNSSLMGYGPLISKYTGSRGKSGSSDASAEYVSYVRNIFDSNGIVWQTGELGKVDIGGGGTIAQYVANLDIDTIDMGVALLSMHSPMEVASKFDIYMAYEAYKAFIK